MLRRLKIRHLVGFFLISYQIVIDFMSDTTLDWYYEFSNILGLQSDLDTYEGPFLWVSAVIFHRAIIHTTVTYCFTGSKKFTHLYGIVELTLIIGMVIMFVTKLIFGEWILFSFNFFDTFLNLLKSPSLLVIFLPSYFLFKQEKRIV